MTPARRYGVLERWLFACSLGSVLLGSCGPTPERSSEAEAYRAVLSSLREELAFDSVLAIHPLLILRASGDIMARPVLDEFNATDTTTVPRLLAELTGNHRLCRPTAAGACGIAAGGVAIILSETIEYGPNGLGVQAIVTDGREGRRYQTTFLARLKRGIGGDWTVVELRPVQ